MQVQERQIVNVYSIHQNGVTSDSIFSKDIFINFEPDEVIIKNLIFVPDNADLSANEIATIRCDRIIGDLITFPTGYMSKDGNGVVVVLEIVNLGFENHFVLKKPTNVNGRWTFTLIYPAVGSLSDISGILKFTLEFIKYS